jgi:hypothetical protein
LTEPGGLWRTAASHATRRLPCETELIRRQNAQQCGNMKSAYELAMERLAKSDPDSQRPLTAEQKARLAEIDTTYKGKIAEREIFLKQRLDSALAEGNLTEIEQIRAQLQSERARLEEEREDEKERVRKGR